LASRLSLKSARSNPDYRARGPTVLSPDTPTSGHGVVDDKEGMVMRYLDETDEAATKIVKLIGDICGIFIYTGIVGLLIYTVLR
jgi:hypothetical protein